MKKILWVLLSLLFTSIVFASNHQVDMIKIYAKPNKSSSLVTSVPYGQRLIPIFHQKGWEKVGVRATGSVGWVNIADYRKIAAKMMQPDIQTVYIQSHQSGSGKKPEVTIVAYQNGKKVTDKEAKALYQSIQKRDAALSRQIATEDARMDAFFKAQNDAFFTGLD